MSTKANTTITAAAFKAVKTARKNERASLGAEAAVIDKICKDKDNAEAAKGMKALATVIGYTPNQKGEARKEALAALFAGLPVVMNTAEGKTIPARVAKWGEVAGAKIYTAKNTTYGAAVSAALNKAQRGEYKQITLAEGVYYTVSGGTYAEVDSATLEAIKAVNAVAETPRETPAAVEVETK